MVFLEKWNSIATYSCLLDQLSYSYAALFANIIIRDICKRIYMFLVLCKLVWPSTLECLFLWNLLQKEEFAHTAYATNAYVALGTGWRALLQGTLFELYVYVCSIVLSVYCLSKLDIWRLESFVVSVSRGMVQQKMAQTSHKHPCDHRTVFRPVNEIS